MSFFRAEWTISNKWPKSIYKNMYIFSLDPTVSNWYRNISSMFFVWRFCLDFLKILFYSIFFIPLNTPNMPYLEISNKSVTSFARGARFYMFLFIDYSIFLQIRTFHILSWLLCFHTKYFTHQIRNIRIFTTNILLFTRILIKFFAWLLKSKQQKGSF